MLIRLFIGSVAASNYLCNSYSIFKPEFILQTNGKYAGSSLPTFGGKGISVVTATISPFTQSSSFNTYGRRY
ncbi:hypothetical protein MASR2M39_23870 [Ignavibacteriales bacterium]